MGLKSRNKGKLGERQAAKYLQSLGYLSAYRTQQFAGRTDVQSADVICPELPNLHIEVKYGYPISSFDCDKALFGSAIQQALDDKNTNQVAVVMWKPKGQRQWRLSCLYYGVLVTVATDKDVALVLVQLNNGEQSHVNAVVD